MLAAVVHVRPLVSTVQELLLQTLPHGGQRGARRNAWASMSADAAMARARREAAALDTATARAEEPFRAAH